MFFFFYINCKLIMLLLTFKFQYVWWSCIWFLLYSWGFDLQFFFQSFSNMTVEHICVQYKTKGWYFVHTYYSHSSVILYHYHRLIMNEWHRTLVLNCIWIYSALWSDQQGFKCTVQYDSNLMLWVESLIVLLFFLTGVCWQLVDGIII